jgi:hypothetical protein
MEESEWLAALEDQSFGGHVMRTLNIMYWVLIIIVLAVMGACHFMMQ